MPMNKKKAPVGRPRIGAEKKQKMTISIDWDLRAILEMIDNKSAVLNDALRHFQKEGKLREYLEGKQIE